MAWYRRTSSRKPVAESVAGAIAAETLRRPSPTTALGETAAWILAGVLFGGPKRSVKLRPANVAIRCEHRYRFGISAGAGQCEKIIMNRSIVSILDEGQRRRHQPHQFSPPHDCVCVCVCVCVSRYQRITHALTLWRDHQCVGVAATCSKKKKEEEREKKRGERERKKKLNYY